MKIVFFTTSTFSDIQEVQTACIRKFFPESHHVKFDGRRGWFMVWYQWLDFAKTYEADWYVHIDEDCFITSKEEIENLIQYMTDNEYDIAGPPDGHFEYRSGNHMAFNSFFMIMNKRITLTMNIIWNLDLQENHLDLFGNLRQNPIMILCGF